MHSATPKQIRALAETITQAAGEGCELESVVGVIEGQLKFQQKEGSPALTEAAFWFGVGLNTMAQLLAPLLQLTSDITDDGEGH